MVYVKLRKTAAIPAIYFYIFWQNPLSPDDYSKKHGFL